MTSKLTPSVLWAQRTDKIFLTVEVSDSKDVSIDFQPEGRLHFSCSNGEGKEYALNLEFFNEIVPEACTHKALPRAIQITIKKKEGGYWDRLLKDNQKKNFLESRLG